MAGDWMKVELELPDKPEVHAIAGTLGLDPDMVVGKLIRVWQWFDKHTTNGNAFGVTYSLIDRITLVTGFGEAMMFVGWLEQNDKFLSMPKFERHTSKSAKTRALTGNRVKKHRSEEIEKCNDISVTKSLPEKRREDINKDTSACDADLPVRKKPSRIEYSETFESFWKNYPRNEGKAPAYAIWQKLKLDDMLAEIVAGLQWSIKHNDWDKDTKFCPHAQNWLKARRWEDAPKEKQKPVLLNAGEIVTFEGQQMTREQMQEIKRKRYEERTGYAR